MIFVKRLFKYYVGSTGRWGNQPNTDILQGLYKIPTFTDRQESEIALIVVTPYLNDPSYVIYFLFNLDSSWVGLSSLKEPHKQQEYQHKQQWW